MTTYEQHKENSYRVDLGGKNLLGTPMSMTGRSVTVVYNSGSLSLDGTGGSSGNINNTSQTQKLSAGTYTMSIRYKSGTLTTNGTSYIRLRNSSGDGAITNAEIKIKADNYNASLNSATFTLSEDTTIYLSIYVVSGSVYDILSYDMQIEKRKCSN